MTDSSNSDSAPSTGAFSAGQPKTGFATRAIHAGQDPDPATGSVIVPIHATSTYAQDGVGGLRSGYEYSRTGNPTRTALEECLAALENGRFARAFASGMAATDVFLRAVCRPGDHIVIPDDAYGGTFRLVDKVLRLWGIENTPVALSDVDAVRAALSPAAAGTGRGRRAALHHQVRRRPLRRHRRRAGHVGSRTRRADRVPAERWGSGARPVRRVADPAWSEDAGDPDGAAQRQRRA